MTEQKKNLLDGKEKFLSYDYMFLFDFETSGLDFENDRIIELGGILLKKVDGKMVVEEEVNLFNKINFELPETIINLTGITNEMLQEKGIPESEIFDFLHNIYMLDNVLFIAYNLQFDITFMINMFKRHLKNNDFKFKKDVLDVMAIYKDFFRYPWKLDNCVENLKVSIKNTHRAIDDALATYEALRKLIWGVSNNADAYINTLGYVEKYGVNGIALEHVKYIPQRGGRREIIQIYK